MPGKDIFLSYASEDRSRILPLVRALEGAGWTVFWDRTIPAGKTWRQVVGKELEECRSMVVAWSRASVESDWVLEEADKGKRRGILVVPVRIDEVEPPLGFGAIQAADLVGWDGTASASGFRGFLNGISTLIGKPPSDGAQRVTALAVAMGRLWREMQLTDSAFHSQNLQCGRLVETMKKRLGVTDHSEFEAFLFRYHEKMIRDELFVFQQIRAVTEGTLAPANQRMLDLLRDHPELDNEVPSLAKLRQHLQLWLTKYENVFRKTPGMAVCYIEDDVRWPEEAGPAVREWIETHKP